MKLIQHSVIPGKKTLAIPGHFLISNHFLIHLFFETSAFIMQ